MYSIAKKSRVKMIKIETRWVDEFKTKLNNQLG